MLTWCCALSFKPYWWFRILNKCLVFKWVKIQILGKKTEENLCAVVCVGTFHLYVEHWLEPRKNKLWVSERNECSVVTVFCGCCHSQRHQSEWRWNIHSNKSFDLHLDRIMNVIGFGTCSYWTSSKVSTATLWLFDLPSSHSSRL